MITGKPLTCDHLLTYTWQRHADGTETETLKCLYCQAYVVDMESLQRLRDFAWHTPFIEAECDGWSDEDDSE